ncbi:MAG: hypothetical protein U0Y10_04495 [Spirosomataceae bacterium]
MPYGGRNGRFFMAGQFLRALLKYLITSSPLQEAASAAEGLEASAATVR